MKTYLLLAGLLLSATAHAQVTYNPFIQKKFKEAVKQELSQEMRAYIESLETGKEKVVKNNGYTGACFFITFEIDTLNKKEWRRVNRVAATAMPDTPVLHTLIPLAAPMHGDSLLLSFGAAQLPFLVHYINKGKQTAYFTPAGKKEAMQLTLNGEKVSRLEVPVKIKSFILSNNELKSEEYIYGRAEIESAPWYQDQEDFFKGYLAARLRAVYYFMFKATPVPALPLHSSSLYSTAGQK